MPRKRSQSVYQSKPPPKRSFVKVELSPKKTYTKVETFDFDVIEPNRRSLRSNSGYKDITKVGEKYQACVPDYIPPENRVESDMVERECRIWAPPTNISDAELDSFVALAMNYYDFSQEEALGFIHFFQENVDEALQHIEFYKTGCRRWSDEEMEIFNNALQICNKDFKMIQKMLPERSMGDILQMYYKVKSLKKIVPLISLMDKREAELKKENEQRNKMCASTEAAAAASSTAVRSKKAQQTAAALLSKQELLKLSHEKITFKENSEKLGQLNSKILAAKPHLINAIDEVQDKMKNLETANSKMKTEYTKKWTKKELRMLDLALREHGFNYEAISKIIATKTIKQIRDYCLDNKLGGHPK